MPGFFYFVVPSCSLMENMHSFGQRLAQIVKPSILLLLTQHTGPSHPRSVQWLTRGRIRRMGAETPAACKNRTVWGERSCLGSLDDPSDIIQGGRKQSVACLIRPYHRWPKSVSTAGGERPGQCVVRTIFLKLCLSLLELPAHRYVIRNHASLVIHLPRPRVPVRSTLRPAPRQRHRRQRRMIPPP